MRCILSIVAFAATALAIAVPTEVANPGPVSSIGTDSPLTSLSSPPPTASTQLHPGKSGHPPNPPKPSPTNKPECLGVEKVNDKVDIVVTVLTGSFNKTSQTTSQAEHLLAKDFKFLSESLTLLRTNTSMSGPMGMTAPVWTSRQDFIDNMKNPSLGTSLQGLEMKASKPYSIDCTTRQISFSWTAVQRTFAVYGKEGGVEPGKLPLSGMMFLELKEDGAVAVVRTEFNTAAWYGNQGKACGSPEYVNPSPTASPTGVLKWK